MRTHPDTSKRPTTREGLQPESRARLSSTETAWLHTLRSSLSKAPLPQPPSHRKAGARLLSAGDPGAPHGNLQPVGARVPHPGIGFEEAVQANRIADELSELQANPPAQLDVEDLVDEAHTALQAARRAGQLASAALGRSQAAPDDAALQRQTSVAWINATQAARSAAVAQRRCMQMLGKITSYVEAVAVGAAHYAHRLSNHALHAVAARLEQAGGDAQAVAALRGLKTPAPQTLLAEGADAAESVFERAIEAAQAREQPGLVQALKAASLVRSEAQVTARWYDQVHQSTQGLRQLNAASVEALRNAAALHDNWNFVPMLDAAGNMDELAGHFTARIPHVNSQMRSASDAARRVLRTAQDAGLAPTGTDIAPLRVEVRPAGEPGEMVIGGTVIEVEPAANAALGEAGAQAGAAARGAVQAAVARHGAGSRHALDEAAHQGTLAPSQALAAKLLEHPRIAAALRVGGKVLGAAALAAITVQLGEAIHTDVKNGDRSAPATRKVLEELLGGTVLGFGGAAVGARVGAALGSLAGPVSAAVGGFIGGLFGGALGYAAGAKLVDEAIAAEKQPLAHLIDGLVGSKPPPQHDGAAIVKSSGSEDDHVNARELRQGLKALNLEADIGERQLAALINAYGSRGVGALSPTDIDQALADGALRIDVQGQVTVEPSEFTLNLDTAGQEGRAANIAKRLVNLGSNEEGADRRLNTEELMQALEDAGCNRSIDEGRFERLVAAYGRSGEGTLDEEEIAQAIRDGALDFETEGGVFVRDQGINGQAGDSAGNIALRIVKAGPGGDLFATAEDLKDGMKAAGFDPQLSDADWQALINAHGNGPNGRIDSVGLARAIADGTLAVDAAGEVSLGARER